STLTARDTDRACHDEGVAAVAAAPAPGATLSQRGEIRRQCLDLSFAQREPRHMRGWFLARGIPQPARELALCVLAADVREIVRDRCPGDAKPVAAVAALGEEDLPPRFFTRRLCQGRR